MNTYEGEVLNLNNPYSESNIDDGHDEDKKDKEVNASFSPAVYSYLVDDVCRIMVVIVDLPTCQYNLLFAHIFNSCTRYTLTKTSLDLRGITT